MSSNLVARVRSLPIFVLALSILATACMGTSGTSRSGAAQVRAITSVKTLQDTFNADVGATRLILLVSPT